MMMTNLMRARTGSAAFAVLILALAPLPLSAATYYVDVNWGGATNGTITEPYTDIGAAVLKANGIAGADTIYVADGTYSSTANGGKEGFGTTGHSVTQDVSIYGGYAGMTGGTWDATRVPRTTIIDLTNANSRAFLRTKAGGYILVTIDGFTFRNSLVTQSSYNGGAIHCLTDGNKRTGLTVNDCRFENNRTTGRGGALYLAAGYNSPAVGYWGTVRNCDFADNFAACDGGAMVADFDYPNGTENTLIESCTFTNNQAATNGGAVLVKSPYGMTVPVLVIFSNCVIRNNSASATVGHGGAVAVGEATGNGTKFVKFYRTVMAGNTAKYGGAVSSYGGGGERGWSLILENCLIAQNTAGSYALRYAPVYDAAPAIYGLDLLYCTVAGNTGGGLYSKWTYYSAGQSLWSGCVRVRDSIVANNGTTGIYYDATAMNSSNGPRMIIEFDDAYGHSVSNYAGTGPQWAPIPLQSLTSDPLFRDLAGGDFRLQWASPCINSGTNLGIAVDIVNVARPQHTGYDMGCYEAIPPATIQTDPATNVTLSSACFNGTLSATGATPTSAWVYWGTTDGGPGGPWATAYDLGPQNLGGVTTNIGGLASNTVYFYRYAASNDLGTVWATNSQSFMTSEVWIEKLADANEAGLVPGTFAVHRASAATNGSVTVNFQRSGTAVQGQHYQPIGTTVVFQAGSDTAILPVVPINDTGTQVDTTLRVTIVEGPCLVGSPAAADLIIFNLAPQLMTLSATDPNADEQNQDPGVFTFNRTGATAYPVTVNYAIAATASSTDYVANPPLSGTISMAGGQTTTNIVITPILDWLVESNETITLTLVPGSYDIGSPSNGTVVISNYYYAAIQAFHVDVNWSNANGLGTSADPSKSLQRAVLALNQVSGVVTVKVADGVYASTNAGGLEGFGTNGYVYARTPGYSTYFVGGYPGWTGGSGFDWSSRTPRSAIVDLTNANTHALSLYIDPTFLSSELGIDGFTFRNANHTLNGGALDLSAREVFGFKVANCLFTNNVTTGPGGGAKLWCRWTFQGIVTNCDFIGNRGGNGGGLHAWRGYMSGWPNTLYVRDSRFVGNTANGDGGGLYLYDEGGNNYLTFAPLC